MRLILPILLALIGVAGGGYVGYILKPEPVVSEADAESDAHGPQAEEDAHGAHAVAAHGPEMNERKGKTAGQPKLPQKATDSAYVPIERKLIVPIRRANGRKAFVALDATLEVDPHQVDWVKSHEPKTVDAFLRVLIAFAATGAFDDHAETAMALDDLNAALETTAHAVLGDAVRAVLIANLITQDA